jgi:pimeloyl-ACP methyl ester carboxylesterase
VAIKKYKPGLTYNINITGMKNISLVCLLISHCAFAQITKLTPGNSQPGFISITRFDTSRPAIKEKPARDKGRIIQVNIWYPSAADTRRMHFADYAGLVGKELDNSLANKNWKQKGTDKYFEWPASAGADKNKFAAFLNKKTPMLAYSNAKWLKQKYPLVMLVHGFAADHAYLAEYLASNGYVVMHVPVKGTKQYELDYEGLGLEPQVKDYEFALTILQKEFPTITDVAATIGFSFGGQSAVALAIRNQSVKAVISLDGGIGSFFGAQLLSNQSYYRQLDIMSPILHLYNPDDPYTHLSWFTSIRHSDRFLAAMKNMQHGHFTSFGLLNKAIPGIMGKKTADPGNGYETALHLTKEFLDKRLHHQNRNKISGKLNIFILRDSNHAGLISFLLPLYIAECL